MRSTAWIGTTMIAAVAGAGACLGQPREQRGYYDSRRLETMRNNLARFDWARTERTRILAAADKWLLADDQRLRTLVPPPEVPRAIVAHTAGAPENGDALNRKGRYSWIVDFERPWKVTSPIDGTVYPSNDFAAFLTGGCTDRSLLTGDYPDDGWGCRVEGFDKPFWFVGVYAHWSVIRLLLPAIENLSKAYLLSDDPRYAHACAVLLHQLAEYYPRYVYETQSRYGTEVKPDYRGRLLYHTWEALYTCHVVPPAYDAIRPALPQAEALLEHAGLSAAALAHFIEERLLVTMATDIMDGSGRIAGNYGMHQVALLRIAAALARRQESPTRQEMINWIVKTNPKATGYVQLGLEDALANLVHRDGHPFENPGYNTHWSLAIAEIVSELGDQANSFLSMPRFRKLYTWPIRMAACGRFSPAYGDGGNILNHVLGWDSRVMLPGYRFYRDPLLAKALLSRGRNAAAGRDLFSESLEEEIATAAETVETTPGTASILMPGVGFGSLQEGQEDRSVAATLFYGYYWGHRHYDTLSLDLFSSNPDGSGSAWIPDLGYPETADAYDPRRFGFLSHTICHNTVMIDATRQTLERGRLHLYDRGPKVQVMEAAAEAVYPGTATLYRRTLILVQQTPETSYLVDIFRVRGGSQHDWFIHGTDAAFSSDLALTPPRKTGTLGGTEVPCGEFYDDPRFADAPGKVPYSQYTGSGFQWLFNVQEATLDQPGLVHWKQERAGMRAHLLPAGGRESVHLCDGIPQRRKPYPETLRFVNRRRNSSGADPLESVFVTVFEPYHLAPFVDAVRLLPMPAAADMPVAVEVRCGQQRQIVFNRLESNGGTPSVLTLEDTVVDARTAVLETTPKQNPRPIYTLDSSRQPPCRATITGVDWKRGQVIVDTPLPPNSAGTCAISNSQHHANAVVVESRLDDYTLSVGDDDLMAGRVHVTAVREDQVTFLPKQVYFLEPGMSLVNEADEVVGRIRETSRATGSMRVSNNTLRLDDIPDLDGDGYRTLRVMILGPGDTLTLHRAHRP